VKILKIRAAEAGGDKSPRLLGFVFTENTRRITPHLLNPMLRPKAIPKTIFWTIQN